MTGRQQTRASASCSRARPRPARSDLRHRRPGARAEHFNGAACTFARRSTRSATLSAEEADRIQAERVDFYIVRAGDTWESIARAIAQACVQARVDARDHERQRSWRPASRRRAHPDRRRRIADVAQAESTAVAAWSSVARAAGIVCVAAFACLSYLRWLTLPTCGRCARTCPTSTAFMRLRADEARAARPRRRRLRQRWLSYSRISPDAQARGARHRGRRVLRSRRHRLDEIRASIEINWREGSCLRGGSTITQQLAKNLYLSPSRNPYRKVVELMITRRLEAELPKARILELYLNLIEWGDGIWGAEAAARTLLRAVGGATVTPSRRRCSPARSSIRASTARPGRTRGCSAASRSSSAAWAT